MSDPVLVLQNLTVGYKKRRGPETAVLTGVSLQLYPGELVCLIGPNGAGKSTLLRSTAGLQQVLKGSVLCNNEDIFRLDEKDRARRISVVLTERVDAGMITVFSLVSLGRYPYTSFSGKLGKQDVAAVYKALEDVGGSDLIHRPVNTLSDGERQKIMIARALAQDTDIIILDEPTAFLDLPRRVEILGLLKRLARDTAKAILLSTHDLHLALRNADRLWLIGEDTAIHSGAPEDLIINQQLEKAFTGKGISFDRYHGAFISTAETKGSAGIIGSGLHSVWVKRALERSGFKVEHRETKNLEQIFFCVSVESSEDSDFSCTLISAKGEYSFSTVFDLMFYIGKEYSV